MPTKTRFKPIKKTFQMSADGSVNAITLTLTHVCKGYVIVQKSGTVETCRSLPLPSFDEAMLAFDKHEGELSVLAAKAGFPAEYVQKKTGRKILCPGEAHKNPFIDHCMICLPGWGEIDELEPMDLERAKTFRLDIPVSIPNELWQEMQKRILAGEVTIVQVNRKIKAARPWTSYYVYRWTGK